MLSEEIKDFLLEDAVNKFLRYVKVWTTSDESSQSNPSSENQFELGKILAEELKELNLENVEHDKFGYVYADLPANAGLETVKRIGLIAHIDTSPAVSGKNVKPVIHKNYNGETIEFASNMDITLTVDDSPILKEYIGLDIITSEGDTLLGADDKAGIAEIMAACSAWQRFSELKHGPITICFTPDEEVGRGTLKINRERLPEICYTVDGSEMGELEIECFDAWKATITFTGLSIHPGYAKNLLINATHIACRFLSEIPEYESPEHTENREGFYFVGGLKGTIEKANTTLIIRDYTKENNERRMNFLLDLKNLYELRYPGLKIDLEFVHQYSNMLHFIEKEKNVVDFAEKAIQMAGMDVNFHSIRGGTDGAKLSEMGIPTPNIFTGGSLFHSKKEHIPTKAFQKASEVLIGLANLWASK
ncbi:MAG: peptidase T [Candidatus Lokiarchaeota archaeon]|nr:peptidase T [Candidatus Lokiarchaeota archaeon]